MPKTKTPEYGGKPPEAPPLAGASATDIRTKLVEALLLDLVGPSNSHAFAHELLPQSPRRWYLTGFLVPRKGSSEARASKDEELEEEQCFKKEGDDQGDATDKVAETSLLACSMGMSVMLPPDENRIEVTCRWGDYYVEKTEGKAAEKEVDEEVIDKAYEEELAKDLALVEHEISKTEEKAVAQSSWKGFRRESREEHVTVDLEGGSGRADLDLPNSGGLKVVASWQALRGLTANGIPDGTRTVSIFLVNDRATSGRVTYKETIFQAELELKTAKGFFGRPDLRGAARGLEADADDRIADLHYRDALEYAVGHGVSVETDIDEDGFCRVVRTTFIPMEQVPRMDHAGTETIGDVELGMEPLAEMITPEDVQKKLGGLVDSYRAWIEEQKNSLAHESLTDTQRETANDLLQLANTASERIAAGIEALKDASNPACLEAFRIANRAMARAARQRFAVQQGKEPKDVDPPKWRVFQLAFLLMNLRGMDDPTHWDRRTVDLLFFPTGGGKTEAYLGLAAFTLVLRRLKNPGIGSAGVSIIMRYTLRLLTLDQLGRAAALMCALEMERESNKQLGSWPFEIGLWVGSAATPNRMGRANDTSPGAANSAYSKLTQFHNNSAKYSSPIPLEECPWCGTPFASDSFQLDPTGSRNPDNLLVACNNMRCEFSAARNARLPIVGVDEPIYRRLPCFLIATVDKFAALPWTGRSGALFGRVERYDEKKGFFGPCDPNQGKPLPAGSLPPPDLIIQDELHLISGPLGTVAGIYETVIEQLCQRDLGNGKIQVPKIVASTATVRQAARQIRALFGRESTSIFPPQGPDRDDSFFARTVAVSEKDPGRLYLGIAAQGRSMKVAYLKTCLALLSGCEVLYRAAGGKYADNPADPYMSLLSYFNSLRELGGSRRIAEDEITSRLQIYWKRRRREPEDKLFCSRTIKRTPLELTSRVETDEIAKARRELALAFDDPSHTDMALATNMISVGLDIGRLGLMVVFGQPKTTSEYIQATSRVGRLRDKPGLVVTLLNPHKPRDRSHYERFAHYHKTFYRSVESTSVTPFSPGALDRALAGALVGLCRHSITRLEPYIGAGAVEQHYADLQQIVRAFATRAAAHDASLSAAELQEIADRVDDQAQALLADWCKIAREQAAQGVELNYQKYEDRVSSSVLLRDFLDHELATREEIYHRFRANRSMREVETPVDIMPEKSPVGTQPTP